MGARVYTTQNLFEIVHKKFVFDGVWREALEEPEMFGMWQIIARQKQGKTTLMLLLADMLTNHARVLIISAEQGLDADFVKAVKRCKISPANRNIGYLPRIPLAQLKERLKRKRNAEKIVFIDNTTFFKDLQRAATVDTLIEEHPDVLFIFVSHEDKDGELVTAVAKHINRGAKRIIRVEGLAAIFDGRVDGKRYMIDEEKALLYHGQGVMQVLK